MEIGFVVIGRNEGPRLRSCLESVCAASSRIVYADSASTDDSVAIAHRLGVATVNLPDDDNLTAARGRNAGYAELRKLHPQCDAVMFLDGDCILQPGFLEQAAAFLERHPDVAIVCGRRFERYPQASIYNRLCDVEWDTPVGQANECGGDALVRCAAFDQVRGYRSELRAGEEPEMAARMRAAGWKIWRIDAPMTEHDAKILKLSQWWRRAQRGGFGYAQVWSATKPLRHRLYGKQLRSGFAWTLALPAVVIIVAVLAGQAWILLAVPAIYALQFFRIASRSHAEGRWTRAALLLLAKIPETVGALQFTLSGTKRRVPEYKSNGG
jgi:glycosyltransferase involved in cell wall biosynthesis